MYSEYDKNTSDLCFKILLNFLFKNVLFTLWSRSFRNQFGGAVFLRQSVFKAVWRENWLLGATLTSKGGPLHVDIKPMPWAPAGVGSYHRGIDEWKPVTVPLALLWWLEGCSATCMWHEAITRFTGGTLSFL
jgi:hypothetical protein